MTGTRVILGVSHSLSGLAAIRYAVDEARRRDATLHAVRVSPYPPTTRGTSYLAWERELGTTARNYTREAFDSALGGLPRDVPVRFVVECGRAATVLTGLVDGAGDLLIVGAPASRWRAGAVVRG